MVSKNSVDTNLQNEGLQGQWNEGGNKTKLDYIQGTSIRNLIDKVNWWNSENPTTPIIATDIVNILREGDSYILLYYK